MKRTGPIKVLIVDDSPLVRSILTSVLSEEQDIVVVGGAKDPYEAREMIIEFRPDVIILDIEMPSVDVLFDSAAETMGKQLVGILLTGMGADGAKGLLRMREAGAVTIGQDRKSCVVYGMPKVAAEIGAVQHTGAPAEIPWIILQALRHHATAKPAGSRA